MSEQISSLAQGVDRREFSRAALLAMFAGVVITITDCGSSSPTGVTGGDKVGAISANHGHSAVVTEAQQTAANAIQLNIQGTASHSHTVTLAADEVRAIAAGTRTAKESTNDSGHSHTVTFN
jgi:hypothetical protein